MLIILWIYGITDLWNYGIFFGTADYTDYTEFGAYGITDLWNY